MIAVKAMYRAGEIEFLEPPPALEQTPVIVIFLEPETGFASELAHAEAVDWGDPMDAEGAQLLITLHEELAPYRIAAAQAWDPDTEA